MLFFNDFFFFFNRSNTAGTNISKICVGCFCMYVLVSVCVGTGFVD